VFLDNVWALDFATLTFRLYAFDADGPYEIDGTFTHTPPAPPGGGGAAGGNGGGGAGGAVFWLALVLLAALRLRQTG
jgi:hypothetical protein